jgi:hypothetical protein
MIQLPQEAIEQLRKLFKDKYNKELTDKELKEEAIDLLYIYAFSEGKLHLLNHLVDK